MTLVVRAAMTDQPISLAEHEELVSHQSAGAIVGFVGMIRDHDGGRASGAPGIFGAPVGRAGHGRGGGRGRRRSPTGCAPSRPATGSASCRSARRPWWPPWPPTIARRHSPPARSWSTPSRRGYRCGSTSSSMTEPKNGWVRPSNSPTVKRRRHPARRAACGGAGQRASRGQPAAPGRPARRCRGCPVRGLHPELLGVAHLRGLLRLAGHPIGVRHRRVGRGGTLESGVDDGRVRGRVARRRPAVPVARRRPAERAVERRPAERAVERRPGGGRRRPASAGVPAGGGTASAGGAGGTASAGGAGGTASAGGAGGRASGGGAGGAGGRSAGGAGTSLEANCTGAGGSAGGG